MITFALSLVAFLLLLVLFFAKLILEAQRSIFSSMSIFHETLGLMLEGQALHNEVLLDMTEEMEYMKDLPENRYMN